MAHDQLSRQHVRLKPRNETLYMSQDRSVFATDLAGRVAAPEHGLFVHETRVLSKYRYFIDGQEPVPVALSNVEQNSWLGYYVVKTKTSLAESKIDMGSGQVQPETQKTLEMIVRRQVTYGLREELQFTNYTDRDLRFRFELEVDADFADQFETSLRRVQKGELKRAWDEASRALELDYRAHRCFHEQNEVGEAEFHASVRCAITFSTSDPRWNDGRIAFEVALRPRETWRMEMRIDPRINSEPAPDRGTSRAPDSLRLTGSALDSFSRRSTDFGSRESDTLAPTVIAALRQAKADLASLRLHDLDVGPQSWTIAAGLPTYVAFFGRDALSASWQAGLLTPEIMSGTLERIARWQGTERNDWRDEEPGKMLHEAHTGPMSVLNYFPRARYSGSSTTSILYPFLVSQLWHWTGNKALVARFVEPALRALHWADTRGDIDGDGFYEYLSRSKRGTRHQGWKDSDDAVVDEAGSQLEPPIAMAEEQAFAYLSKLHFAEALYWLGRKDEAKLLLRQARELKKRFNDRFWVEDLGFFAMGLDARKRPIRSIGSDAGHCLATGIADDALARRTAERLMRPDLFSGWGIRTLSSDHPAYNPYSYHRGSVWPVENGTFAVAFTRFGFHDLVERLTRALFEAASLFEHDRLPELFSGHPRDERHPFPALYPRANTPQAWSSSAMFNLVQALLGLYPYAPLRLLVIDPHLPAWLPELEIRHLRVGDGFVSLRFKRGANGRTSYRVLDQTGPIHVVRQPNPWSLTATAGERARDGMESLLWLN